MPHLICRTVWIIQSFAKGNTQELGEGGREQSGKGFKKNKSIKTYNVHVPTPHNECNHYVLQTHTNKK